MHRVVGRAEVVAVLGVPVLAAPHGDELRQVVVERAQPVVHPGAQRGELAVQHVPAGMELRLGPVVVVGGVHRADEGDVVGTGADVLRQAGYRPQLIVGDPDTMTADVLRCGAQVVLPADADGHAPGLDRIQDLGIGAMTFPAAGSATDLALLLADHHGAALIVTAGHTATIEEFFDRTRARSNPSTFLTRLKLGHKLVDAKAVATLYRSRISAGAIAFLVLAMLVAIIVALWVSRADHTVLDWISSYWNRFLLWVDSLVS